MDLDQQEAAALMMAWSEALEDPALTEPPDHATLLLRSRAAIDMHPRFKRHGTDGEDVEPQMLAQVSDIIGRMAKNPLGVFILRSLSVRMLRNLMDRPSMHNVAGDALVEKLIQSCGRPGYTGDGYVTLALIMAGLADPAEALTWGQHGSHVLGPTATAMAAWEACGDACWVLQTPGAPWIQAPTAQPVPMDGSEDGSDKSEDGASGRRTDGLSMCSAGSFVGTVVSPSAHHRSPPDAIVPHVLDLPETPNNHRIFALKDSARIIAPHAGHSKACGERAAYVRNFLMIERELAHSDARACARISLVSTSDAGSVPQRTLLKLLLPPGLNDSRLDARFSSTWRSTSTSEPANLVDYFHDGLGEGRQKELILLLIVQFAVPPSNAGVVDPAVETYPWQDIYFEQSLVLAILRTDDTPNPAAIFMCDQLSAPALNWPGKPALHAFVTRAFLECPIFRAHCTACSKPPAAFIVLEHFL